MSPIKAFEALVDCAKDDPHRWNARAGTTVFGATPESLVFCFSWSPDQARAVGGCWRTSTEIGEPSCWKEASSQRLFTRSKLDGYGFSGFMYLDPPFFTAGGFSPVCAAQVLNGILRGKVPGGGLEKFFFREEQTKSSGTSDFMR